MFLIILMYEYKKKINIFLNKNILKTNSYTWPRCPKDPNYSLKLVRSRQPHGWT
jgi:hypothetical protein